MIDRLETELKEKEELKYTEDHKMADYCQIYTMIKRVYYMK